MSAACENMALYVLNISCCSGVSMPIIRSAGSKDEPLSSELLFIISAISMISFIFISISSIPDSCGKDCLRRSGGFLLEELRAETAAQAAKQEERLPELQEFYESCEQALLGHRSVWKQQLHSLKLR